MQTSNKFFYKKYSGYKKEKRRYNISYDSSHNKKKKKMIKKVF